MKRLIACIMVFASLILLAACGAPEVPQQQPEAERIENLCEFATMDCYYHNVAKFKEEDAGGFFWNKKDKHFWIEYSGQVTLGIDASKMKIEQNGTDITISMPPAEIQGCRVEDAALSEDSFIMAADSIAPSAEDQTLAFKEANQKMLEAASRNRALLNMAQEQARSLIENYIHCVENLTGTVYNVNWVYLSPDDPAPADTSPTEETDS